MCCVMRLLHSIQHPHNVRLSAKDEKTLLADYLYLADYHPSTTLCQTCIVCLKTTDTALYIKWCWAAYQTSIMVGLLS